MRSDQEIIASGEHRSLEEYLKAKKEFAEYLYTEKKFKKLKEDIEKTEK